MCCITNFFRYIVSLFNNEKALPDDPTTIWTPRKYVGIKPIVDTPSSQLAKQQASKVAKERQDQWFRIYDQEKHQLNRNAAAWTDQRIEFDLSGIELQESHRDEKIQREAIVSKYLARKQRAMGQFYRGWLKDPTTTDFPFWGDLNYLYD
ncbi:hypothetical protein CKAH01_18192 [Colletotrichum kahawae]|uniref:Uncharacterized protein n=1 Tax=Colletotrichum kahawae TaxID=34407 RepID=A0AAD9Y792_COLKA|nr:hypothetical protein CKAH01_18192 [Colletotrichum kahawae]